MVSKYKLIENFEIKNIKPAGYELRIGNRYAKDGKIIELKGYGEELRIEPFKCIIVTTEERLNMPTILIARWNLRVHWVYEGLLWLGAPQVDPGYYGHLFCPIFNLSNRDVILKKGDALALIDFVRTTKFKTEEEIKGKKWIQNVKNEEWLKKEVLINEYNRPPSRRKLEDYNWKLKSGLFTEIGEKFPKLKEELEDEVSRIRRRLDRFITIIISIIALLMTVLSITITVSREPLSIDLTSFINILSLIISIVSIIIILIFVIFERRTVLQRKRSKDLDQIEKGKSELKDLIERVKDYQNRSN